VDNTSAAGTAQGSYGYARLSLGSAVTAGAGTPSLTLYGFPALDGTNIANPPGTTAQAPGVTTPLQVTQQVTASAAFEIVDFGPFPLDGTKYAFQIYNNSGIALTSTATLTLFRDAITS
jgi:hypothetical protein